MKLMTKGVFALRMAKTKVDHNSGDINFYTNNHLNVERVDSKR